MVDSCVVISSSATSSPLPVHVDTENKCNSKSSDDDDGPVVRTAITKRAHRVQPIGPHSNRSAANCPILSRTSSVAGVQVYPITCQPTLPSTTAQTRLTFYSPTVHNKYMSSSSRSRGTQRWMKLRTTVQLTGAVTSAVRDKKPPLKREDSFLKRFSTRQTAEVSDDDDDGDGCPRDIAAQDARRRKRNQRRTVINPDENIYFWWLTVITSCVLYNCWTLIVRQAFPELQSREPALWNAADALCDVLFLLDVVFQLRTGYLEQGLIVYNSRKLAKHYVHSRAFLLDVSSLFPLDLLRLYVSRPAPLLRFPRFLKVYRSYNYYYMVESRTLYPNLWRVVNLIHILLLLAHWFGCFYFLLSEAEGFVGEWVYPQPSGDYAPLTRKYLASLYWSTLTLTTIGDLPTPESNLQPRRSTQEGARSASADVAAVSPQATPSRRGLKSRVRLINSDRGYLFTIVSYLIGVFIFATIVGQVGNVITNRNANRLEFERLLDGAKLYMRHHKVPRDMQRRVQRWYDYTWSRGRMHAGGDINTALGILPDKLKTELALHVNLSTLKKVTIFQECQPEFLHDLVLKMKAYIFTPGDLICRKGEVAREMFIIADGILEVISEAGKVLTTMKAGDFFGEIGILNLDGLNRRTADVRSVGYSELFSLSREDVLGAMKDYPEAQEILQTMGKKRLMEARKAAVNAKKELSAQESLGSESGKDAIGPDSESARQKAVLMVRRLRRDAKDLRNYLMKSSSKGTSTLFRSKDRSNREDVRIEMETVNSGRDISKTSVKKRQGSAADEKHSSGDRADSVEILGQSSVASESEAKPTALGGRKTSCVEKSLSAETTGPSVPPVARVQSTFLQRVLALKNSQAQQDEGKRPSVSQGVEVKTVGGECPPPADGSSEGGRSCQTMQRSVAKSTGSNPKEDESKKEDTNQPPLPTAVGERKDPPAEDQSTEADKSATAIQAWTATIASSMPFQNPPDKPVTVDQQQNLVVRREDNTDRRNRGQEAREGQVVKSILKHFSRSESDVSELFSNSSGDGALVANRKLTKTVSFRDQLAQVNSLADPDASFRQEECVSGLLFGIKHVLQLRLDDIQSQFKMRLVALETAMHNKEDVIHQLEAKIQELETRKDHGRQGSAEQSANDWLREGEDLLDSGGEQACGGAEGGSDLTHPGYVCHPRRSWPMLPSKQRLCRHRSAGDLHPDHLWRAEFPARGPDDSAASSAEEGSDTASEITDWEEDEADEDGEEEAATVTAKDEEERFGSNRVGTRAANDWEIKMLAQEMIKQEATSKLDLADVAEEEEEEEEEEEFIEEDDEGAEAGDVVRQLLTGVEVQLGNAGKEGVAASRNFPRKLCRQQSWSGEAVGTSVAPRRRDSMPTAEDHVIQHFVHSTLRRLDQLEKVFTARSNTGTAAPPATVRRHPLQHQCSLQEQHTAPPEVKAVVATAMVASSSSSSGGARRGILHRHASLGETSSHPALSLLNIPLSRPGTRSPPLSSFGTPLLPATVPPATLTSSCVPPSPTHPFTRTMSTIAEPGESNLLNLFGRDRNRDSTEEEDEEDEEESEVPFLAARSPATDDDGSTAPNLERQPLLGAPRP